MRPTNVAGALGNVIYPEASDDSMNEVFSFMTLFDKVSLPARVARAPEYAGNV